MGIGGRGRRGRAFIASDDAVPCRDAELRDELRGGGGRFGLFGASFCFTLVIASINEFCESASWCDFFTGRDGRDSRAGRSVVSDNRLPPPAEDRRRHAGTSGKAGGVIGLVLALSLTDKDDGWESLRGGAAGGPTEPETERRDDAGGGGGGGVRPAPLTLRGGGPDGGGKSPSTLSLLILTQDSSSGSGFELGLSEMVVVASAPSDIEVIEVSSATRRLDWTSIPAPGCGCCPLGNVYTMGISPLTLRR